MLKETSFQFNCIIHNYFLVTFYYIYRVFIYFNILFFKIIINFIWDIGLFITEFDVPILSLKYIFINLFTILNYI